MYFMVLGNDHLSIEIQYACLTWDTVIKKDSILVGVSKATNIYFPGIVPESVLLLVVHAKIFVETEDDDIRHSPLCLPIFQCAATEVLSWLWDGSDRATPNIPIHACRFALCLTGTWRRTGTGSWCRTRTRAWRRAGSWCLSRRRTGTCRRSRYLTRRRAWSRTGSWRRTRTRAWRRTGSWCLTRCWAGLVAHSRTRHWSWSCYWIRESKWVIHENTAVLSVKLANIEFPIWSPAGKRYMLLDFELWRQTNQL